MEKLWKGRFSEEENAAADSFNSSFSFDRSMFEEDIKGSLAHAKMLVSKKIISEEDGEKISAGLSEILLDIKEGKLSLESDAEDIHTFVESELTARIGDAGRRLHTARSRNDQVAVDTRLFARKNAEKTVCLLKKLIGAIADKAEENTSSVMPGYTHMQRAQPISFAHQILAYGMMFRRDISRINDAVSRMDAECPLGACALAGTTFDTDRVMTASLLGFAAPSENSIDSVSDRDYTAELIFSMSLVMTHLSRFAEEIILWSSWEFGFVELSDAFTTGSSIMPQKKNPDIAELVRGKTGRVYGDLVGILTVLKGLPLAYNKDMQEDKEALFDAFDTVNASLEVFAPMVATMKTRPERMLSAAKKGFINATDLADYLAKKGVPFRTAYKNVGEIVAYCVRENTVLEDITVEKYREFNPNIAEDVYDAIDIRLLVDRRISQGGTSGASVAGQISSLRSFIA